MKGMKTNIGNVAARMKLDGMGWAVVALLFADDTVSIAENEGE